MFSVFAFININDLKYNVFELKPTVWSNTCLCLFSLLLLLSVIRAWLIHSTGPNNFNNFQSALHSTSYRLFGTPHILRWHSIRITSSLCFPPLSYPKFPLLQSCWCCHPFLELSFLTYTQLVGLHCFFSASYTSSLSQTTVTRSWGPPH